MHCPEREGTSVGDVVATWRPCHLWNEDLDDPLLNIKVGTLLLVLGIGNIRRPKRLNPMHYRQVLTPTGDVGWINLDNCVPSISLGPVCAKTTAATHKRRSK